VGLLGLLTVDELRRCGSVHVPWMREQRRRSRIFIVVVNRDLLMLDKKEPDRCGWRIAA